MKKISSLLIIIVMSLSLFGCNAKLKETVGVNNDISKMDIETYQIKDVSLENGRLIGRVFNDDDYMRDLTLSVTLLLNNKEISSEEFVVESVDVGGAEDFNYTINDVKYDNFKVEVVGIKFVEN